MKIEKIYYNSVRRLNVNYENKLEHLNLGPNINIFIGENGSGKSTIIDIVRSLIDIGTISSLPKENPLSGTSPSYGIKFDKGSVFVKTGLCSENRSNLEYFSCKICIDNLSTYLFELPKFHKDKTEVVQLDLGYSSNIYYVNISSPTVNEPNEQYINELSLINSKLNGYFDRCNDDFTPKNNSNLILRDDGYIDIWSKEDDAMSNKISTSWLPFGWRKYAEITSYINSLPLGSVCLLEEPEIHMHPTLQRLLLKRLQDISIKNDLQLLMSTHSPAMINVELNTDSEIFHTKGGTITPFRSQHELLSDLGFLPSDIFQSNCIIWVEGPSDKIYIKMWLNIVDEKLIEGVDYSFVFYGGKLINHYEWGNQSEELISMLKINANSFIVLDSDFDNEFGVLRESKQKIIDQTSNYWVTDGREIENYLEPSVLLKSIRKVHANFNNVVETGRWANLLKYKTISGDNKTANKVKVAKAYSGLSEKVFYDNNELRGQILALYEFILSANKQT
ncbi:ATP-binding protein [Vibrio parahaemolyticus]|nr:ATP-binding protein [Vibrio parahaemolyticus]EKA7380120.1 AAA family ATPase [Vibrio parahaemolyticus]